MRDSVKPEPSNDPFKHYIDPRPVGDYTKRIDEDLPDTQKKAAQAVADVQGGREIRGASKLQEAAQTILLKDDRPNPSPAKELAAKGVYHMKQGEDELGAKLVQRAAHEAERETLLIAEKGEEGREQLRREAREFRDSNPQSHPLDSQWQNIKDSVKQGIHNAKENLSGTGERVIGRQYDEAKENIAAGTENARASVNSGIDYAKDRLSNAAIESRRTTRDAFDTAKEKATDAATRAREVLSPKDDTAWNRAEATVEHGREQVRGAIDTAKEKVQDVWDKTKDTVQHGVQKVEEALGAARPETPKDSENRLFGSSSQEKKSSDNYRGSDQYLRDLGASAKPEDLTSKVHSTAVPTETNTSEFKRGVPVDDYWKPRDFLKENHERSQYRKQGIQGPPAPVGSANKVGTKQFVEGVEIPSSSYGAGGPTYRTVGDREPGIPSSKPLTESVKDDVKDALRLGKQKTEKTWDETKEVAEDAAGAVRDKAGQAKETVKEAVSDSLEKVKDAASNVAAGIRDKTVAAADTIKDTAKAAVGLTTESAKRGWEATKNQSERVGEAVKDKAGQAKEYALETADSILPDRVPSSAPGSPAHDVKRGFFSKLVDIFAGAGPHDHAVSVGPVDLTDITTESDVVVKDRDYWSTNIEARTTGEVVTKTTATKEDRMFGSYSHELTSARLDTFGK
eukprot:ANDGO_06258.mRNA.1 hypothetical protein